MSSSNTRNLSGSKKSRFHARKSVVTEHRLREIGAFGGNPIPHSDYHLMLEDMVHMSIRRQNRPLPMLKLQGELLTDLVEAEDSVAQYKKKLAELEQCGAPEDDLTFVKAEYYKYRRLKYALRDIGDGIAWRFLGFDRCVLSQMGVHPRKQHINKEGTANELYELADVINRTNEVAILNDITHILKKGDITARLSEEMIEFIEVKSSNTKSSRLVRQRNDLEQTISFLNEGEKTKDGEQIRILNLPIEPRSYMRIFERHLMRAESECLLAEKIGEHLLLHITDFHAVKSETDPKQSFRKRDEIRERWEESGDLVMDFSSIDRHLHVQNFAPFSVFPIQHKYRVKLMTGALLVGASLNVSSVLRYLSSRGWTVVKRPEDFVRESAGTYSAEIPVAALKKGPLTVHLPMPMLGRLAHEYLSIKTLGDMLDALLKTGWNSADKHFIRFAEEDKQWQ